MTTFSEILEFQERLSPPDLHWADYLFDLGSRLAALETSSSDKACILLVLPTVALAAPILTLGYIYKKLKGTEHQSSGIEYFESLPLNCALLYRTADGLQHAVYEGTVDIPNPSEPDAKIRCIRVRTQNNRVKQGREIRGGAQVLTPPNFHKITVVSSEHEVAERSVGKTAADIGSLARKIYCPEGNADMAAVTNSACIIGKPAELEQELTQIAIQPKAENGTQGNFNDLLRLRHLLAATEPPFSQLISCFKNKLDYADAISGANFAVFRESMSYLKHQHNYKGSKVLLLDFADRGLDDAIGAYNQLYYKRKADFSFEASKGLDGIFCAGFLEAA